MKNLFIPSDRRSFIKKTVVITTGLLGVNNFGGAEAGELNDNDSLYHIGPKTGYSPQIGTLVSMLNFMRNGVITTVKKMTQQELDHLQDEHSNSIGSLILHLGATEKFYQINTFEGRQEFNAGEKKIWGAAMGLGEEARKTIKGNDVKYYLYIISEVREKTLSEFGKKDDAWLLAADPVWSKQVESTLNTYWKWFHVCEHESNHRGQIKWLQGRLPGAKPGKD
jgi:hypothetical protein